MRIIAGNYRSRVLKTLQGDNTRPTTDKVREAVFSRLGPYFEHGSILDLFAGSGAVALEAISRGYDHAVLCDKSREAVSVIKYNIIALKAEEQCTVWQCDYKQAARRCHDLQQQFDMIYVDPPYKLQLGTEILKLIDQYDLLKDSGIVVIETELQEEIEIGKPFELDKEAKYGITKVTYVRKERP